MGKFGADSFKLEYLLHCSSYKRNILFGILGSSCVRLLENTTESVLKY